MIEKCSELSSPLPHGGLPSYFDNIEHNPLTPCFQQSSTSSPDKMSAVTEWGSSCRIPVCHSRSL